MSTLRYHGGKNHLAHDIRELFPPKGSYKRYAEPFFGGGSVLFQDDGMEVSEHVNDIYGELINFWRVLRGKDEFDEFKRLVEATPFGEPTYDEASVFAYASSNTYSCAIKAWAFFVINRMSRQGLGKDYATPTNRIRRGMNENVSAWLSAVEGLEEAHYRLKRVEIHQKNAVDFILEQDHKDCHFYVDPPYLDSTRTSSDQYVYEYSDNQHKELLNVLSNIQGTFCLSGYGNTMYRMYAEKNKWSCHPFVTVSHAGSGAKKQKRVDMIWKNY